MAQTSPIPVAGLGLDELRTAYEAGSTTPSALVSALYPHWVAASGVFIHLQPLEVLLQRTVALEAIPPSSRGPLHGIPFATKDNVDVAGTPTTAACPAFKYTPSVSAPAVQALEDAGAINVGKTNLDQFASGLVGTRTPYGVAPNAFDDRFIPGGSSSGSAAAVGGGLLSFALGTDTAGSGRVPAGYNGCVGIKGTLGRVSTKGVVPACASKDCLTVLARSVPDGAAIMAVMETGHGGADDVWRRHPPPGLSPPPPFGAPLGHFKFALPGPELLEWDGAGGEAMASASAAAFAAATERLVSLGGELVPLDCSFFAEAASMLYQSSLLAERYSGLRPFLDAGGEGSSTGGAAVLTPEPAPQALTRQARLAGDERLLPVTRAIITGAAKFTAVDVFDDIARLAALGAKGRDAMKASGASLLLVPTALEHYTLGEIAETEDSPAPTWPRNAKNGRFTNFVNLLDMCGVSVPSGLLRVNYGVDNAADSVAAARGAALAAAGGPAAVALPFGVTLLAPAWQDDWLWRVADAMHRASGLGCGPAGHGVEPVAVRVPRPL